MTAAQDRALKIAFKEGRVYAGWNPGSGTKRVSANVLDALARLGLLTVEKTSAGEHVGVLTREGAVIAGALP
jgi:hypothetical protein